MSHASNGKPPGSKPPGTRPPVAKSLGTKPPSTRPPSTRAAGTPVVPPERRAGIYESDEDVTALLWYGTHVILPVPREQTFTTAGVAHD